MNPQQITKQIETGGAVLIDVREKDEWDAGHIQGARHISLGDLNAESTKDLSKDLPIYVYCRSGGRAGIAESIFHELGFSKASNIGGIIQ